MPLYAFSRYKLYLISLLIYFINKLRAIQNFTDSDACIKDLTTDQFFDSFVFV